MQRDGTRTGDERSGVRTDTRPAAAVHRSLRQVGVAGLAVHLTLVLWLVLRPLPVAWVYDANLTPLASLRSSTVWQVVGELLLLAPLGVLLPLAGGRLRARWLPSFLRTTGASALLATGLEFLSSWTPGHVLNVDHILFAVIGVAVAHIAFVPAMRALLRDRRPRVRAPKVTTRVTPPVAAVASARVYAEPTSPTP
ncbi:VanZ family protein [Streptomyces kaniharaensis]|uniref:VanZ family protein n=1 Tax=Streptomyces kaniharaensis TaxID=212423 RepID=A0A6N7KSI5_9ACTN|nr:VanZ family protein [Streptomyces kaniharaensis]MQS12573.1 VanZ family protein [Streptomyces kaniharaensis]